MIAQKGSSEQKICKLKTGPFCGIIKAGRKRSAVEKR
jgi:hypothetical protein